MKKILKILSIILLIMVLSTLSLCSVAKQTRLYDNDVDCINAILTGDRSVESFIYKYDNGKQELFFIKDTEGEIWTGHLKVMSVASNKKYKFTQMYTCGPNYYYSDWSKEGMFKYVFLKDKDDIEKYDCEGKTPICTELDYIDTQGKRVTGYFFLLD